MVRNPEWKSGCGMGDYYIQAEVEAEVLSVHFNTKKIRIRYKDPLGATQVVFHHLDNFFEKYEINYK